MNIFPDQDDIKLQLENRSMKRRRYLHDDDLHAEDLVFRAGLVGHISKVVNLGGIHLLTGGQEAAFRRRSI